MQREFKCEICRKKIELTYNPERDEITLTNGQVFKLAEGKFINCPHCDKLNWICEGGEGVTPKKIIEWFKKEPESCVEALDAMSIAWALEN